MKRKLKKRNNLWLARKMRIPKTFSYVSKNNFMVVGSFDSPAVIYKTHYFTTSIYCRNNKKSRVRTTESALHCRTITDDICPKSKELILEVFLYEEKTEKKK